MRNLQMKQLIGKFINQQIGSDTRPVGKIIAIKGKTKVVVQPITASENKTSMQFSVGGFSAVCLNQDEQQYEFIESGDPIEIRLSESAMKNRFLKIHDEPRMNYDYNF
jgi:hypothetical protein